MISTANITMQFGTEPLFENISAKFSNGNRYGLIGANGCGKSTFMKILSGELAPTFGNVSIDPGCKVGTLSQDQFAFEQYSVVDAVIMGDVELWKVKQERDRIYSLPAMSEEDGMKVADLEILYGEMDGYSAESRAGEILLEAGIEESFHFGLMSQVAPGWKLRVLLAQALFADPEILLLDEPTNNLDIYSINWLADMLNQRKSTMVIISHDRHFLNSVCTHMADIDYGELRIYPGNYEQYMAAASLIQEQLLTENAKKSAEIDELQAFVDRFSANASKAKQASSRARRMEKISLDEVKISSRQKPYIRLKQCKKLHRQALILENLGHGFENEPLFSDGNLILEAGARLAVIGENGAGKTSLINAILGFLPYQGSIKINGTELSELNQKQWYQDINWVGQNPTLVHGTIEENMTLGKQGITQEQLDLASKQAFANEFIDDLGYQHAISDRSGGLSVGQAQRLALARALLQQGRLWILDEPTASLDAKS